MRSDLHYALSRDRFEIPAQPIDLTDITESKEPGMSDVAECKPGEWLRNGCQSRKTRVSLVMIVRDEEANLAACLDSAAGLFDELIVLDTGSRDRTKEIAHSFGARVFDFVWIDDFAAARNAATSYATGDYAFWLDADERIDPRGRTSLEKYFAALDHETMGCVLPCICDGDRAGVVLSHLRCYPNRPEIRWDYRLHEQIIPSLTAAGIKLAWADAPIHHTGYSDPRVLAGKNERNLRIVAAELAERPEDAFVLFNMGRTTPDPKAALSYLQQSLAASQQDDSITAKLHALIAARHQELGELQLGLEVCQRGRALYPGNAEILDREATINCLAGNAQHAEDCWRGILELTPPERPLEIACGMYGHMTRRNLAVLAEERGALREAFDLWSKVLAECPDDKDVAAIRARLARTLMISWFKRVLDRVRKFGGRKLVPQVPQRPM